MNAGIDLGSRTIKMAVVENGRVIAQAVEPSGFDPRGQAETMLSPYKGAFVVATGYGRHLAQKHFADEVITEIKAHAMGVRNRHPGCRTVIDVGGQDAKVILLDDKGRVERFIMNDKCAAGTGRFLEIMASSLGYALGEFGPAAENSTRDIAINSMCTVFAESEVISLKNQGQAPVDIARAVHLTVVDRIISMLEKLGWQGPVALSGGVAKCAFIRTMLEERLQTSIPPINTPEIMGALGAALHGELKRATV